MPRIVDELHEPRGRRLVRQPLHALAAGGRISAIWGTVRGPSSASAQGTEGAAAQLVMSPVC